MRVELEKASGRSVCRNHECLKKPDFISDNGCIKAGTVCAAISLSSSSGVHTSYYCRDCIDKIYIKLKSVLDSKLWIFH